MEKTLILGNLMQESVAMDNSRQNENGHKSMLVL